MNKVYIIAEAGVNHNGDIALAKQLIIEAKIAGADAVKFQTFVSDKLVSQFAPKAEYQKMNTGNTESQLEMLKKLELTFGEFAQLKEFSMEQGIDFISTPFDMDSIDFLNTLDMPFWKIPSGEITNRPYLEKLAKTEKPIILSTGMCSLDEITEALEIFREYDKKNITLLHCNTQYPTPFEDVNLHAMQTLRNQFKVMVGYSDHTIGIEVPIAAVALGASVVEKHITLDKNMPGPDHKASLELTELKAMVSAIRNIEKALGDGVKKPSPSETGNLAISRKSIVADCKILKGEIFTEENLTTKRPGDGISPMQWNQVLGRSAIRDFELNEKIEIEE